MGTYGIPFPGGPNVPFVITAASNIPTGENPDYLAADFLKDFPVFQGKLQPEMLDQFITLGQFCVLEVRFRELWRLAIGNFIAHTVTMYLQTQPGVDPGAASASQAVSAAMPKGMPTSKSVGDVSVSYDFSFLNAIPGWNTYKTTTYGIQFMTYARLVSKGGMGVY
jgi:hypothetical protein